MPLPVVLIPPYITKFSLQLSMVLILPVLSLWIPAFVPDSLTKIHQSAQLTNYPPASAAVCCIAT